MNNAERNTVPAWDVEGTVENPADKGFDEFEKLLTDAESWDADPESYTDRTAFEGQFRNICITESAISPDQFEAAIDFISGQDIYESLGWDVPKTFAYRLADKFSQAAVFRQESGEAWQLKLDVSRVNKAGKLVKYESPVGGGSPAYLPPVSVGSRRAIGKRYGVEVPETGSFWVWVATHSDAKKVPLVLTEGGKKTLALLSAGYMAIGLMGCNGWRVKGEKKRVRESIRTLVKGGRAVKIALDSDEKPTTKEKVDIAIAGVVAALELLSCDVRVCRWDSSMGKGVDDVIAAWGVEAFDVVIAGAKHLPKWEKADRLAAAKKVYEKLSDLAEPTHTSTAPKVGLAGFPAPILGYLTVYCAGMNTGKTYAMTDILAQISSVSKNLRVRSLGHRNNLLKQSAKRIGLTHINDCTGSGGFDELWISNEQSLALCLDSLHKSFVADLAHMRNGGELVIWLDEVNAIMDHLLNSDTMSPTQRVTTVTQFATLLREIARGGGYVLAAEADVTALSVETLQRFGGLKVVVNRLETLPESWDVRVVKCEDHKKKQTTLALAKKLLVQGKRVAIVTTSQKGAEELENALKTEKPREAVTSVLRIDSTTISDHPDVFLDVDAYLKAHPARVIIITPTGESGISIEALGLADAIIGYFPSNILGSYQLLGRFREAAIPRYVIAYEEGVRDKYNRETSPKAIQERWAVNIADIERLTCEKIENPKIIQIANDIAAKMTAMKNAGNANLEGSLVSKLARAGHQITEITVDLAGNEGDILKGIKTALGIIRVDEWMNADDRSITVETARKKLKGEGLSVAERTMCLKRLARDTFGVLVDNQAWAEDFWYDPKQGKAWVKGLKKLRLLLNPEEAIEADIKFAKRQKDTAGAVWAPALENNTRKTQTLLRLDLSPFLAALDTDTQFNVESPEVIAFMERAIDIADEVKLHLGHTVTAKTSPMTFIGRVLEDLKIEKVCEQSWEGENRGKRFYSFKKGAFQDEMLEALAPKPEQPETGLPPLRTGMTIEWMGLPWCVVSIDLSRGTALLCQGTEIDSNPAGWGEVGLSEIYGE